MVFVIQWIVTIWVVWRSHTSEKERRDIISKMFIRHVWKLVFRALLLATAVYLYFTSKEKLDFTAASRQGNDGWFLILVWIALAVDMLYRLFPNKRIAIGARKHYACSYRAAPDVGDGFFDKPSTKKRLHRGAILSGLAWVAFNSALFTFLALAGMLTPQTLIVVMLFYAVCDLVCILFFCPFQLLIIRNRCCVVCRIYNWDCLMMCTPMILYPSIFSISLLLISIAVLLRWEIALHINPRFFMEKTNMFSERPRNKSV